MNENSTPPSSRSALRRLLVVLAITAGVVIYAYGWNVTDISLDEVQDSTRQASVTRALRELLSPDLFARDRTQKIYQAPFGIGCPEGEADATRRDDLDGDAYVVFSPSCADPEDRKSVV